MSESYGMSIIPPLICKICEQGWNLSSMKTLLSLFKHWGPGFSDLLECLWELMELGLFSCELQSTVDSLDILTVSPYNCAIRAEEPVNITCPVYDDYMSLNYTRICPFYHPLFSDKWESLVCVCRVG
jgi:hypothetical protein